MGIFRRIAYLFRLKKEFASGVDSWEISDLRRFIVDNLPIASTPRGLFYPASKADLEIFERHIKRRIFTMWKRMKRVAAAFPGLTEEGQLELFEFQAMQREIEQ